MVVIIIIITVTALWINSFLVRLQSSLASSLLIQVGLFIFVVGNYSIILGNLYSIPKKDTF